MKNDTKGKNCWPNRTRSKTTAVEWYYYIHRSHVEFQKAFTENDTSEKLQEEGRGQIMKVPFGKPPKTFVRKNPLFLAMDQNSKSLEFCKSCIFQNNNCPQPVLYFYLFTIIYHHGFHNCEVWQQNVILHNVTRHLAELSQVAFHTIDQNLTTCIFCSKKNRKIIT